MKIKRLINFCRRHLTAGYLIIFAGYLASVTIQTTMFNVMYSHRVGTIIQLVTVAAILVKISCFDQLTERQLIGQISLLTLITLVTLISGAHYLVTTVLLMMGARGVSFRRIMQIYLWIVGGILLIALVAAELGIIKNITFVTNDGVRQSLGVVYTTDFAAHIFYLCGAYLYLQARYFRLYELLPVLVGGGVIYYFTKTMTDTLALLVLIILFLIYIYRRQLARMPKLLISLRYSFLALPVASLSIIGLSVIFNFQDTNLMRLNAWLSSRLELGNNALLAYGVKILGQSAIPVNGWGGERANMLTNGIGDATYFFIDSSFLNALIAYGLLFTIVLIVGFTWRLYDRVRQQDYLLPVIFVAIAISSMFDQHFLEITYNVFILMAFAKLPTYRTAIGPAFNQPIVMNQGGAESE
ncbi:polysaccharide biosynthesis protein [Lactiplantibacillus herbarum]|uniref:polysaccharide biosynthesis protein n=1 Tax=Lactiplantibacillus herbarum TaxID=1670446 RepID=UPI00064E7495|nr:polysaccharide biosynthesis protein [Lactiplantibacillus herbarum]